MMHGQLAGARMRLFPNAPAGALSAVSAASEPHLLIKLFSRWCRSMWPQSPEHHT
jgi:hypothetical protein